MAQAAHEALVLLRGAEVDDKVIEALEAADPALKTKLVDLTGQRRIAKALAGLGSLAA